MTAVWAGAAAVMIAYAVPLFSVQHYWYDEVALFSRCAEEVPDEGLWRNRLGLALQRQGDLAGARRQFEAAVSLDRHDGASLYDLGLVYQALGDQREAAHAMEEGLKRLPHPFARRIRQPGAIFGCRRRFRRCPGGHCTGRGASGRS